MIFPLLKGLLRYSKAPITWLLFFLNAFCFILFFNKSSVLEYEIKDKIRAEKFLLIQGELYSQFILENTAYYSDNMYQLAIMVRDGQGSKREILGSIGFRDKKFLNEALSSTYEGDKVAEEWWRDQFKTITTLQGHHPSYRLGLSSRDYSYKKWFTYQFTHSSFMHFLSNMIFLLIFGCALEGIIGSLMILITYLSSGFIAAGVFLLISEVSPVPLVGASGSISGLMALFCLLFWKKSVRYIFFLFIPAKGYAGYVYLPGWVAFLTWFFTDLAGYLSNMNEFGGIAYTAHLGGQVSGLFMASLILAMSFFKKEKILSHPDFLNTPPIGTRVV